MQTRKNIKHKLIIYLNYGLPNRVFQILSAMGFAEKWNMDLYISEDYMNDNDHTSLKNSINDIKQIFPKLKILDKKYDTSNFSEIEVHILEGYEYKVIKNPKQDTILYGQFANDKFFPSKRVKLNLIEPKNSIVKGIHNPFFIHFRLGDYKDFMYSFFDLNLENYYVYSIRKILEKHKDATFIILSNNIKSAKKYINEKLSNELMNNKVIYDEKGTRLDTLYYMSQCKGGICVNSTFSWIGAYSIENKNKKLIFMPNKWLDFTFLNLKILQKIGDYIVPSKGIFPDWVTRVPLDVKI
jgi:hypothetical protein